MSFTYFPPENRPEVFLAKGMLTYEDYGVLYSLGRAFRDNGLVLDLGAFCGASAHALALGIKDGAGTARMDGPIHSFDLFINQNRRMDRFIREHFYDRLSKERSPADTEHRIEGFRQIFEFQTGSVSDLIVIHEGSLLEFDPSEFGDDALEVVNVDIAKSFELSRFILEALFPRLMPGAHIFQQDINIPDHWYILASMMMLRDHWSIVHVSQSSGWVFRVDSVPGPEALASCCQAMLEPDRESVLALREECRSQLPPDVAATIDHGFAFWYYERFGTKGFSDREAFFEHFRVKEKGYHAKRLRLRMARS